MRRLIFLTGLLALAGCGSSPPAPVIEGGAPVAIEGGRPASESSVAGREGFYVVKKGDNLYRIALAHGVTTQDIMSWNDLTDETRISVGQELRVMPADAGVEVMPITAPAPIVVVGDGQTPVVAAAPDATSGLVRQPKGGKIPYSDTALAQAQAMDHAATGQNPTEIAAVAPTVAPAPTPGAVPSSAPTTGSSVVNGVDWTWPAAGDIVRGFVPGGEGKEANRGIDLAGHTGEPIYAAAAGRVTYVGTLRGYGSFMVVRHNADYISVYAHASKILVKRDQTVTKGQKIAEVGSTDADQPKLHFEIRHKSEPVDPLGLLPARQ
ncbi:MAG: peptidoglycan DD-metalloendopeptidase family protein [Gammaproteobacteria bacterium]|nr:peptidoglycan DD-metalloendopeptidase family protein [Gammaproteobacteria bacterium]MBU1416668.1 peptidoglycan DD-metalloendopeptidase family protein [Gammaproteobacteria bacterium]